MDIYKAIEILELGEECIPLSHVKKQEMIKLATKINEENINKRKNTSQSSSSIINRNKINNNELF